MKLRDAVVKLQVEESECQAGGGDAAINIRVSVTELMSRRH